MDANDPVPRVYEHVSGFLPMGSLFLYEHDHDVHPDDCDGAHGGVRDGHGYVHGFHPTGATPQRPSAA